MKKSTFFEFFDVLCSKINCCLSMKNIISKLNFLKFSERNFIDFLSRLWMSCWHRSLALPFVLIAILLTGYTLNAQNIKGVVPVEYPRLGSGVDGDAFAHQPDFTGSLYVNVGDLFDNLHPTIAGHGLINPFTGEVFYKPTITNPPSPQTVPVTYELNDPYTNDKTIFTSSNKINDNPKTYTWGAGTSPNKNEIQNCGASFSYGSASVLGGRSDNGTTFVTTGTATGLPGNPLDLWCLFAGDRQVTNGSSYIDFEFLQARLTMTGAIFGSPDPLTNIAPITGGSGAFLTSAPDATGGRTVGDILVTIEFTQGGGDATVVIRRWELVSGTYQYKIYPNSSFTDEIYCTNNSVDTPVPFDVYGSGFGNGIYAPNQWAEGAINLTQVFGFFNQPCFAISTLFIRTRSSGNSAQSELKDFPGAPIQLDLNFTPAAPIAGPNSRCGEGTVSLSASGCNGTLNWYAAASGGSSIGTGSPFVTPSISTTTSFYVSCSTASGCEGPRTEVVATVNQPATVNAGADQTVCASSPNVTLAGSIGGGASSGTWSGGTGIFNPNATTLNAVYTPSAAEITAGTVTLTLTTDDPAGACLAVSDTMTITINPAATANAGADQTVCASSPAVTLAGSVGGGASSGTWSGGTGTFNPNATTLTAVYTPSAAEIAAGTVTLTLTTNDPSGPCPAVSDTMTITINSGATANAGADQTVCASSPAVTLAGSVGGGASSGTWSGGTGTFNPNATTLNAVYTPSAAEITAGTVTLTLTTNDPEGPCTAGSDTMTITINPVATANAGADQTVCASSPNVTLAGSVGGSASSGTWSGGTGTFNPNATTLNAVYTPSAAEITAGTVTLTLTTNDPTGPCPAVSDTMTITISPNPACSITGEQTVCTGGSSTFTATAGMTTYSWTGPGGFTAGTPSITVSVAGIYEVTITDSNGCSSTCSRELIVSSCGAGCTIGFWKNHTDLWDGVSPDLAGIPFITTTNFFTYFGLNPVTQKCNLPNGVTSMIAILNVSGGGCRSLARQAIAAALNESVLSNYDYPGGITQLKTDVYNAFASCSCNSLAATLEGLNNREGADCSALTKLAVSFAPTQTTLTSKTANTTEIAGFEAYPVPFKDQLTIKYKFDYKSDVKIDVFNAQGISILSKADANSYLNKEVTLNLNAKKGQEQVYVVKVTTDRGSSSRKVISSK
jgi:hypothetical protein